MKGYIITSGGKLTFGEIDGFQGIRQGIGGGYLEALMDHKRKFTIYFDEEGKIKNLPFNSRATDLMRERLGGADYIAGDVVIVGLPDKEGFDTDTPTDLVL